MVQPSSCVARLGRGTTTPCYARLAGRLHTLRRGALDWFRVSPARGARPLPFPL